MPLATSIAILNLVNVSMDLFCSCKVLKSDPPGTYSVTIANCCNENVQYWLKSSLFYNPNNILKLKYNLLKLFDIHNIYHL